MSMRHDTAVENVVIEHLDVVARRSSRLVEELASLMPASWNQVGIWLRGIDELRRAAEESEYEIPNVSYRIIDVRG